MRKLLSLIAVLTFGLVLCSSVYAAEARLLRPILELSYDGITANCKATISSPGDLIDVTMTLKKGDTVISSWSGYGTSAVRISETHTVTKGVTYTLEVIGTAGGIPFSRSITRTC